MSKLWKDIEGFEGLYKISKNGVIRTIKRQGSKGGFKKTRIGDTGYYQVWLSKPGCRKERKVHRLVAQAFIPNPDNKPFVCHMDGNKLNNKISNLYWGTPSENIADKVRHGTSQHGERNARAILTKNQVIAIKEIYKNHKSPKDIAIILGVTNHNVNAVVYGYNWKEV